MVSTASSSSPSSSHSSSPRSQTFSPAPTRKTMSITQTYFLAHKARGKLSSEAARPDHNLRLLVGHANLLDSLMLELAEAEKEQESWFNQSLRGASKNSSEDRHVRWADSVGQHSEDWEAESDTTSDSESDFDDEEDEDEDVEMADVISLTRVPSKATPPTPRLPSYEPEEETEEYDENEEAIYEDEEEEEEDYAALTLTRSPSHSAQSPPELDLDFESSDDESMPPSPPATAMVSFAEKQEESNPFNSTREEVDPKAFYNDGFYLPARNQNRLISAVSVY